MSVIAFCAATPSTCDSPKRADRLHERRGPDDPRERAAADPSALLADDVVDEVLRRGRQDESRQPVDEHQQRGRARDGRGAPR